MLPKTLKRTFYKTLISLCMVSRNLTFVDCIIIRDTTSKVSFFLKRIQSVYIVMVFEVPSFKEREAKFAPSVARH